jgi:NADH-quinone oxidoreductase subunit A
MTPLWPLALYFLLALSLPALMVAFSYVLGQRHREGGTIVPYESGIIPTGSARLLFDVKFYLVAMFFLIFDAESVFIFAWAVSIREAGWAGYTSMLIFIVILIAALAYLWREGALDWGVGHGRRGK